MKDFFMVLGALFLFNVLQNGYIYLRTWKLRKQEEVKFKAYIDSLNAAVNKPVNKKTAKAVKSAKTNG